MEKINAWEGAATALVARKPLRAALDDLAHRARRGLSPSAARDSGGPGEFRRVRDIQSEDPELFDLIFKIQDHTYRRNRLIKDRVWSYATFRERSAAYVIFGPLPDRDADGLLPTVHESLRLCRGFVLGRLIPAASAHPWLKLSGMAGHPDGMVAACGEALACGLPMVAAVEPRLGRIATRAGFRTLGPWSGRCVLPALAPAFIPPPWKYLGVTRSGALQLTHPELHEDKSGAPIVFTKEVVLSPGALRWLLRPRGVATTLRLIADAGGLWRS